MKKLLLTVITVVSVTITMMPRFAETCTTAIVSGKCTTDGRPLLFKNRDTASRQNKIMFFGDGGYDYIGVVSASDSTGKQVWQGVNSAGFAIMNSLSYNMNFDDTTTVKDKDNGTFMKLALSKCATLADFERLLETEPKPLGVNANFGVIDAQGGAAYYESGHFTYTKIDANDPTVAPYGYIVRTNFSFSGPIDEGHGYIRYQTAENLFYGARAANRVDERFILQDVVRCLEHSLTGTNLADSMPDNGRQHRYVHFLDYIPRFSTASSTVVRGVKQGESPELATMWTILGFPLCSVAVPAWVGTGEKLPEIVRADDKMGNAPLGVLSFEMKNRCFPITRGSGDRYLDLAQVINKEGTGVLQVLRPVEDEIFDETDKVFEKWVEKGFSAVDARRLYTLIDKEVFETYKTCFGLDYNELKERDIEASEDE